MKAAYAKATINNREWTVDRFKTFAIHHGYPTTEEVAMKWVASLRVKHTTKLVYFGQLQHWLQPQPRLQMFRRGLHRLAAEEEPTQAPLLDQDEVLQLLRTLPRIRDKVALYVGVRTACRLHEVCSLTPKVFVGHSKTAVYLHWSHRTKTTKTDPTRPDTYVELRGTHPSSEFHYPLGLEDVVAEVRRVAQMEGECAPMTTLTYQRWLALLQGIHPGATGHSIKRTAMTRAAVVTEQHGLPAKIIGRLGKHKTEMPEIQSVTLRYIDNPVVAARLLQTGLLTQYL